MAKFYLDLHECGQILPDKDGVNAKDAEAAKQLAVRSARDVMCGEIGRGALCLSCFIEIRDSQHMFVERVMFRDAITITGLR